MAHSYSEICAHYYHAMKKHPYFADKWTENDHDHYALEAESKKRAIKARAEIGDVSARLVLQAEIAEVFEAITRGDLAQAKEEIFDTIAVLLRMKNVIDGVERFGDPAKKICRKCSNHDCYCNDSRGVCLRIGGVCACANCAQFDACEGNNAHNCAFMKG